MGKIKEVKEGSTCLKRLKESSVAQDSEHRAERVVPSRRRTTQHHPASLHLAPISHPPRRPESSPLLSPPAIMRGEICIGSATILWFVPRSSYLLRVPRSLAHTTKPCSLSFSASLFRAPRSFTSLMLLIFTHVSPLILPSLFYCARTNGFPPRRFGIKDWPN